MFGQLFVFIIGMLSLVLGLRDGDYIWALCGLIMTLSGINLIYNLKTGKNIWDKSSE
ncbi:hypothetical protein L2735_08040 [Shewanella olleyana]|uniref:hypothetical protein n=1 Tax=Shewanella olleyana TaxID=135626 RepID=UPI00201030E3|nr:hypothetical protein [Shewanella olleyana]MCL1066756.1 hypothetical protein [Shewanella olleyana]